MCCIRAFMYRCLTLSPLANTVINPLPPPTFPPFLTPSLQAALNSASFITLRSQPMDQITIKTPNPPCRLYWCLTEFIDWLYSQSCWYFRPLLKTRYSAPLSIGVCIYTVCKRGGGEGIGLCGELLQELCTVYLTRFRIYKMALPPQTKT